VIVFIGDFVRLNDTDNWLEVTDIEPYDICVLQNGIRVCASDEYIAEAKSSNEFMQIKTNNTVSGPWPRGH
jgi:hypothetical protein